MLHFRRPSYLQAKLTLPESRDLPGIGAIYRESVVWSNIVSIAQALIDSPSLPAAQLESMIPVQLRITKPETRIEISSALLYITLQPIFTTAEIIAGQPLDEKTFVIFRSTAMSACTMINHKCELDNSGRTLSLWLEADRVLRCGILWLYYLIYQSRRQRLGGDRSPFMAMGNMMAPLLQVTSLLSSFAARFRDASASLSAWEACTAMLWPMLSSDYATV